MICCSVSWFCCPTSIYNVLLKTKRSPPSHMEAFQSILLTKDFSAGVGQNQDSEVRDLLASWALFNGVLVVLIMSVTLWLGHITFTDFCLRSLEQGWLAQCQFKVTGWDIMFIWVWYFCVLTHKIWLESGTVTADLTTTVIHKYKLLINNVKPIHSLA